ncbi:hypothetical protein DNL40_09130 [Xylanimonas oleitrophica]|uniref:Protein kinase domain-containing protein n=1 Tax=Xylanimonas oleitrophica TaxID=2607479 RepID=A0A2W5WPQ8_9MICO|nr:hypothetical protein [Xylanimonas oleitrophica]PZR53150.1 hypothetical protein DNL40_09130 [Xylanimonas oleitrophica]
MSTVPPGGTTPAAEGPVPAVMEAGAVLVDRYRLEHPTTSDLADAVVWQARDQILDKPVRVTFLGGVHASQALDAARRAALVSDPRLARVLDVGRTTLRGVELPYVITEPYTGSTLTEIVSNGLVDAQQVRAVVGEAATALDAAAGRGVHHLALRPDAVRVDGRRVVVTGLGLDAGLAGVDATGEDGAASDARDLAALAYYALTARWAGDSLDEPWIAPHTVLPLPAQQDEHGDVVPLAMLVPHVDPVLDQLVRRTLGGDDDAPASPAAVADALKPWDEVSLTAATAETAQRTAVGGAPVRQSVRGAAAQAAPGAPVRRTTGRIARAGSVGAVGAGAVGAGAGSAAAQTAAVPPPPPPATPYGYGAPTQAYPAPAPQAGWDNGWQGAPAAQNPVPQDPQATAQYAYGFGQQGQPQGYPQGQVPQGPAVPPPAPPGAAPQGFASEPSPRRGVNPTPIVLTIVVLGVVLGAGWAVSKAFSPLEPAIVDASPTASAPAEGDGGAASGGDSAPTPEEQPTPEARPVIASGQQVSPTGQPEKPEFEALAVDGDPSTFWYTFTYNSAEFGRLKPGVGYAITLREPAPVTAITLTTNSEGGHVEVRQTTPDNPTEGPVLASGAFSPTTELTFDEPVVGDQFVLWISELPSTQGRFRLELNEILPQ